MVGVFFKKVKKIFYNAKKATSIAANGYINKDEKYIRAFDDEIVLFIVSSCF